VTINLNGIEYGLNGPAKGVAGYPDNQRLMVIAENGGYQLGASGAIIQRGLDLCWPSS
jgi:hypothetical protein